MGSSFTDYHGTGFWARDYSIELWLYCLAREAGRLDAPPEWLRGAAEDWHLQATVGMGGCVSAGLDKYAQTPEQVALILELAQRALDSLRQRGEMLSATWLNSLGLGGPGAAFPRDLPTEVFTLVGETFMRLLRGEITWDAHTSPVL